MTPLQQTVFQKTPEVKEAFSGRLPMGRLAETHELADAFVFLLGESASYISGQVLAVDGAFTVST